MAVNASFLAWVFGTHGVVAATGQHGHVELRKLQQKLFGMAIQWLAALFAIRNFTYMVLYQI